MSNCNSTDAIVSKQTKKRSTKRLTTTIFIERAKKVHGSTYCYDLVVYKNTKSKVDIVCKSHGLFSQFAGDHMAGSGCPSCMNRISNSKFIDMCKAVHGDSYSYKLCDYTDSRNKVFLVCNKCGNNFAQIAESHLRGRGCPVCANKSEKSTSVFVSEAIAKHGLVYDYSKVEYQNNYSSVVIGCGVHGFFKQIARNHLRGNGCPECAESQGAFNRTNFIGACRRNNNGNGTLYVIKCFSGNEVFLKIGITSRTTKKRFYGTRMPYEYSEVFSITGSAVFIFDLEVVLHRSLSEFKHSPKIDFLGRTECFSTIAPVERLLKRFSNTDQLQLLA